MPFQPGQVTNPKGGPNWKKGVSANPKGRPKNPEIQDLRNALEKAKKQRKMSLLESVVKRAYDSDVLAVAILRKLIPDMTHTELESSGIIEVTVINSFAVSEKKDTSSTLANLNTLKNAV